VTWTQAGIGLLSAALAAALIGYAYQARRVKVESDRATVAIGEAKVLKGQAQAMEEVAKVAWAAAETARKARVPLPPPVGDPPPLPLLVPELVRMGLLRPAQIAVEDAPVVWKWGKEALRVPGLTEAVAGREREAEGYRVAAEAAQGSAGQWKAAFGKQEEATGHSQVALKAALSQVKPNAVGLLYGTDGVMGVIVQRDMAMFRVGGEVAVKNTLTGSAWDARAHLLFRW
jgi:hypothetical protein